MNRLKTVFLLTVMTLLVAFIGNRFGGAKGMVLGLVIASAANLLLYFFSDKIVMCQYGAWRRTGGELQHVHEIADRLSVKMGIPSPNIYSIQTQSPNAFAVGRNPNHASIAVTDGILRLLTNEELEGVLGHELGHICNCDTLTRSLAATLVGAVLIPPRMLVFALAGIYHPSRDEREAISRSLTSILAPVAAILIRICVSPGGEYAADASGANYTGNPRALARALQKLEVDSKRIPMSASASTAHLFIVSPVIGARRRNFLSSHPSVAQRIERLTGHSYGKLL